MVLADSMDQIITSSKTDIVRFETFDLRFVEVTIPRAKNKKWASSCFRAC